MADVLYPTFAGLNTVGAVDDIFNEETPDARNNDISEVGSEKTRNGMSKGATSALSAYPVFLLFSFIAENEIQTNIAVSNDGIARTITLA